jgi:hypothetical protein
VKKTLKNKKGNIKAQRKRRRERRKNLPPKQKEACELIDGNWSHYPVAECLYHKGFLTNGLVDTHRCEKRHCKWFKKVIEHEE